MSSRSIGVTKVWFNRRMISWVSWSPSCSRSRISCARSRRSGYSASISSSSRAASSMFAPARSNRSKYSRSDPRRNLAIDDMSAVSAAYASDREAQLLLRIVSAELEAGDAYPQQADGAGRREPPQQLERDRTHALRLGHWIGEG